MRALLPLGAGETITDRPGRFVQVKIDHPRLAMTESLYGPGERGPDPHVHRRHADVFFVLEGSLDFEAGGRRFRAGAGGIALVPPGVVHTFGNGGDRDATFLNLHAPGTGFGAYLRGLRDARDDAQRAAIAAAFDSFGPGKQPPVHGEALAVDAARDNGVLCSTPWIKVELRTAQPGAVLTLRGVRDALTAAWVVGGDVDATVGGRSGTLGAGGMVAAPGGALVELRGTGVRPARCIVVTA